MFTAALLTIAKIWQQPRYENKPINRWKGKEYVACIYIVEYYSVIKEAILPFSTTRMVLKGTVIKLNKSDKGRQISYDQIYGIKKPQRHRDRYQISGCKRWENQMKVVKRYKFSVIKLVSSGDTRLITRQSKRAWSSVQFSSVTQSCPTLCDPMNWSTPGLPVHHRLPESTQTHVHWVSDAIQLLSPSAPALNLSQHQGLFKWVSSSHQVAKVLEFQLQHQCFQWAPRTDLL